MPFKTTEYLTNSRNTTHSEFEFPVRNVVRRSPCRVVGYHASKKMGRLIGWESQIERLYLEWLEVDPTIIKFYAQPTTVQFNGSHYTPDVFVVSRTSEYFVEIKPDSVFRDSKTLDRIGQFQRFFETQGSELRLITKSDLTRQPLRDNVERLVRLMKRGASQPGAELVRKHCEAGEQSIDELRSRMGAMLKAG